MPTGRREHTLERAEIDKERERETEREIKSEEGRKARSGC